MKIFCLQENLKTALITTERIIGKNLNLPILNNLLLKTDKGRLCISSTNLEIGITYWVSGKIEKEGGITVPARILSSFIGNLPNKKIELTVKDDILYLDCENYKAQIKGQDIKEYPIIPVIESPLINKLDKEIIKNSLSQVIGAVAISEIRPEIAGVLFDFNKNYLKLVGTDSFRLAEKTLFNKNDFQQPIIVPQKTIQELIRILAEKNNEDEKNSFLKLFLSPGQIMFDFGYIQLVSRLIDGQFPDYQQIIPNKFSTTAILNKEEINQIIKVVSLFSGKINDIQFVVNPIKKTIDIFAQNREIGENKARITGEIEGKNLDIAYNWRYLLDGLNNIPTKKVFWGFNDESLPSILKPLGDEEYVYAVMPVNPSA
ncbi:MAG: DNA polymerase III subunit beta [Candidatus Portnoybacteria bacterium]|nr:DNA polymerase III subunit beta [Candidatus Portnoybacteria bacterium]